MSLRTRVDLAQGCSMINMEPSATGSYLMLTENLQHQAIIPSYKLNCTGMCGSIISWEIYYYAEDNDEKRRRRRSESSRGLRNVPAGGPPVVNAPPLGLQVWRPVPPINDSTGAGCYILIGSQGISSNLCDESDDEGQLTLRPPSESDNIPFQPGDVLGFYVNIPGCNGNDGSEVEYDGIRIRGAPGNKIAWYAPRQTMETVYLIGDDGDLNYSSSVIPAISISTGKLQSSY